MFYFHRSIVARVTFAIGLVLASAELGFAQPQEELEHVAVLVQEGGTPIQFIRLPRQENIGPVVSGDAEAKDSFDSNASYLAQMEMSLGQVKALLSAEAWKRYQGEAIKLCGEESKDPKWKPYRDAIREGSFEFPAILLGIPEIVEVCRNLNANRVLQGKVIDTQLEKIMFRVPSRMEWQFAARGVTTIEQRKGREHFPVWIDYSMVKNLEGRIKDLQTSLGDDPNLAAVASQADMVELVDRAKRAGIKEGYQILGDILRASLGFEPNIGISTNSGIRKCQAGTVNSWEFHRMLGNVAEWTLTGSDIETVESRWNRLLSADDLSVHGDLEFGIVMGGSFISLKPGVGGWARYSIAGGDPVDPASLSPEAYKVSDCLDVDGAGIGDTNGGLRLLMVRTLAPSWFVKLRAETILERTDTPIAEVVAGFNRTLEDICPVEKREGNLDTVDFYHKLTLNREILKIESWKELLVQLESVEKANPSSSDSNISEGTKNTLAIFQQFGNSDKKENDSNDETNTSTSGTSKADFFSISRGLVETDLENKK